MKTPASKSPATPRLHGVVALDHTALMHVRGADAASFLQGQLTQDISGLASDEARLAAYCSPKGRMLASFVAFRRGPEDIALVCRADLLAPTLKRLRMFVLRAKAQLEAAGPQWVVLGVVGADGAAPASWSPAAAALRPWQQLTEPADPSDLTDPNPISVSIVRLPDAADSPRWLWLGPAAAAARLQQALPAIDLDTWDWLEVHSGIAPVQAATLEAFVPQMLNYELVGGVNFKKGCYPGQEVVARSQYRGTLKRRTVMLHGDAPLHAGQEVYWSGDAAQPSGLVALAAPAPGGGHDALVEIKLGALDSGSLHAGALDGPMLSLTPLPYELPRDSAVA